MSLLSFFGFGLPKCKKGKTLNPKTKKCRKACKKTEKRAVPKGNCVRRRKPMSQRTPRKPSYMRVQSECYRLPTRRCRANPSCVLTHRYRTDGSRVCSKKRTSAQLMNPIEPQMVQYQTVPPQTDKWWLPNILKKARPKSYASAQRSTCSTIMNVTDCASNPNCEVYGNNRCRARPFTHGYLNPDVYEGPMNKPSGYKESSPQESSPPPVNNEFMDLYADLGGVPAFGRRSRYGKLRRTL